MPLQYEVHLAFTLTEGLKKMTDIHPDILFLDNNLPDGLGWDHVDNLQEKFPNTQINLMSAYRSFPPELQKAATVKFLEKPISLGKLKNYL